MVTNYNKAWPDNSLLLPRTKARERYDCFVFTYALKSLPVS